MPRRLTLEEAKERLKQKGSSIEIIDTKYVTMRTQMKFRCTVCGYEYSTSFEAVNNGFGCGRCAGNIKLTIEEVKEKLKIINPSIEITSKTYIRSNEKMECFCKKCSTTFFSCWDNLKQKKGCPKCSLKGRSGENHVHWKGGVSNLNEYLRHKMGEWRRDSMKENHYKCVVTNGRFDEVHHLYGFNTLVQKMLEIEKIPIYSKINKYTDDELERMTETLLKLHYEYGLGVTLKRSIHLEFHDIYGKGNNTPEQFREFVKMKKEQEGESE